MSVYGNDAKNIAGIISNDETPVSTTTTNDAENDTVFNVEMVDGVVHVLPVVSSKPTVAKDKEDLVECNMNDDRLLAAEQSYEQDGDESPSYVRKCRALGKYIGEELAMMPTEKGEAAISDLLIILLDAKDNRNK